MPLLFAAEVRSEETANDPVGSNRSAAVCGTFVVCHASTPPCRSLVTAGMVAFPLHMPTLSPCCRNFPRSRFFPVRYHLFHIDFDVFHAKMADFG